MVVNSCFEDLEGGVMPGVGLMVGVVGLGSYDLEFKSHSAVELIPGGENSACHPSEVSKMSASMLVSRKDSASPWEIPMILNALVSTA